ncbi:group-specific protein [Bacillus sp. T33-2]|uniref:group-specific protein n=1 Tax=Bacillus sp. T33-2 TaxID=2054168 RepID=UPI000C761AB0|nr:group-specific protein [Bacillus sp. T33-2]PLR94178.1 group-specific protein [Bacillus sp. T33-2]
MSECKENHSPEDVRTKYVTQAEHLPDDMKPLFEDFFVQEHTQDLLNEVFHLLKKYDLASEEEKSARNNWLYMVLRNTK